MAETQVKGRDIGDGSVGRPDLNVATSGQAVIRKILEVANSGIKVTNDSTGIDAGTGDVKLAVDLAIVQAKLNGTGLVRMNGTTVGYDNTTYYHSGNLPVYPTKSSLGLSNVDNTADANKSVDKATYLKSVSHPTDYWLSNTWDGTYWQLTSNHPSPVNVGRADSAAYAASAGSADNARFLFDEYRGGYRGSADLHVSYAINAGSAVNSSNLGGFSESSFFRQRGLIHSISDLPRYTSGTYAIDWVDYQTKLYPGGLAVTFEGASSCRTMALFMPNYDGSQLWFNNNVDGSEYGTWKKIWHDGNFTPANYALVHGHLYLPLTGGSLDTNAYTDYSNSAWGGVLRIGGTANYGGGTAQILGTDGNLHLDPKTGKALYLGFYSGTGLVNFGDGALGIAAFMDATGQLYKGQSVYWNASNFTPSNYSLAHSHPYRSDSWIPGWGEVTGKPSTFAPDLHTHNLLPSNNGANNGSLQFWNSYGDEKNPDGSWWYGLRMAHGDADTYYCAQLSFDLFSETIKYRRRQGGTLAPWVELYHTGNFTDSHSLWDTAYNHSQTAHYSDANTSSNGYVVTAYNHSQSSHDYLPNRTFGTAANYNTGDFLYHTDPTNIDASNSYNQNGLLHSVYRHADAFPAQANFPFSYGQLLNFGAGVSDFQFAVTSNQNELLFRSKWWNQTWTNFKSVFHTGNLTNILSADCLPVWNGSTFVNSGFTSQNGYPYNRGIDTSADIGQISFQAGSTSGWWSKINIAGRGTGSGIEFYTQSALRLKIADDGGATFGGTVAAPGFYTNGSRPITIENGGITIKGDSGGWAMEYGFKGTAGAALGGFGAYGAADGLGNYYIGTYAVQRAQFISDGSAILNGNTTIRGSANIDGAAAFSGAITATGATINGSTAINGNMTMGGSIYLYSAHIYGTGENNFTSWNGTGEETVAGLMNGSGAGSARFTIKQGKLTGTLEGNGQSITGLSSLAAGKGTFTSGTNSVYGLEAIGLPGGARTIFLAGQSGYSNGFTVDYNGTSMAYNFANGNVSVGGTFYASGLIRTSEYFHTASNVGLVGDYNESGTSEKIIWTIGRSWATLGSVYGLGYNYEPIAGFGHSIFFANAGIKTIQLSLGAGNITTIGKLTAEGIVTAGTGQGFQNLNYQAGYNRIWSFGTNSQEYGMGYYQGGSTQAGTDMIGFHFGDRNTAKFWVDTYGNGRFYGTLTTTGDITSTGGKGTFQGGGFNSRREIKNIHPDWDGDALNVISQFKLRDFNYKSRPLHDRTLGFIIDEIPDEIRDYALLGTNRDAVNTYTLHGLSFKAHQETKTKIELLEEKVIVLENENITLKSTIKQLEGRVN